MHVGTRLKKISAEITAQLSGWQCCGHMTKQFPAQISNEGQALAAD